MDVYGRYHMISLEPELTSGEAHLVSSNMSMERGIYGRIQRNRRFNQQIRGFTWGNLSSKIYEWVIMGEKKRTLGISTIFGEA